MDDADTLLGERITTEEHPRRMATILIPLLVAVVGALIYALSSNGKVAEIGRILFFVGALWLVYLFAGKVIKF